MSYTNVLAKALYDNVAESPDELSFRKGDILTVLERDTQGLDGWWLCSLHGRQGIVPGNRLKILVGMYDSRQQQAPPPTPEAAAASPALLPQQQRPLAPPGAFAPPTQPPAPAALSAYSTPGPAPGCPDAVYMMPPSHSQKLHPQSLYQVPGGPGGAQPGAPSSSLLPGQRLYQPPAQDVYQVPLPAGPGPGPGSGPGLGPGPGPGPSGGPGAVHDVYQVPPSLEQRNWESSKKALGKVVVPTRVGQVYVYDAVRAEPQEYDVLPRQLPACQQDIYDVPPSRQQQQVYHAPAAAAKGPANGHEIYDTPAGSDRNPQLTVYDFPPSVSRDVVDSRPGREETYDVPPHFRPLGSEEQPPVPEDVYDVPPPALSDKHSREDAGAVSRGAQDIYDIPASLQPGGRPRQDVYDFPREREEPAERREHSVYDIPPQVVRDAAAVPEELATPLKRLPASGSGGGWSSPSAPLPVRDSAPSLPAASCGPAKPLLLDLEPAMERLSRLQQAVAASVGLMMSSITGAWRSGAQLEASLAALRQAAERVRAAVRDFLEFAHGAVANAAQASDRTLQAKLGRQVGRMEEVFQSLLGHSQALDAVAWAPAALAAPPPGGDDLDRLILTARGIPDDAKQLASFLHGNASLLFRRSGRQQPLPPGAGEPAPPTGSGSGSYHGGEKANIQSRPLPSPPKYTPAEEEEAERPYEVTEEGWMEDYDYVHLQGKEEFEKNQKQLLERGTLSRERTALEQQQVKQLERLEQEVSRPINQDMSGWVPPPRQPAPDGASRLGPGDRQLLLFYQEQCEQNVGTVADAIDAFFTSVNSNQPPRVFVAHSKFVILSAHKLVFIGDTVARQAGAAEVRRRVAQSSNALCEKLKEVVLSTKAAALQYPAAGAARQMSQRVKELGGCTQHFRTLLGQLLLL